MIALSDNDRLSLRIGQIARAHVDLDIALRWVYSTMVSPGLAQYIINNHPSTHRLTVDIGTMIEPSTDDARFRDAAKATLQAARAAGAIRNRAIHDWWVPLQTELGPAGEVPIRGTAWSGYRIASGRPGLTRDPGEHRDLSWLDDALVDIQRARIRVSAMQEALWEILPFHAGSRADGPDRDADLEMALRTMEDRFDLLDEGAFRVEGG